MYQNLLRRSQILVVGVCSLLIMLFVTACAGVATNGTGTGTGAQTSLTGKIVKVDKSEKKVVLNVNGTEYTIGGLTDAQLAELEAQVGQSYTVAVQGEGTNYVVSGDNAFGKDNGQPGGGTPTTTTTEPTPAAPTPTPKPDTGTSSTPFDKAGEIDFVGKVDSMNGDATTFVLANGEKLTVHKIPLTKVTDLFVQMAVGQMVKVEALADVAGKKFVAEEYQTPDPEDTVAPKVNEVKFNAFTTSGVQNNKVNFQVGDKKFSANLVALSKIDAEDFPGGVGAIQANQHVSVDVTYSGSNGTITEIDKKFP